MGTPLDYRRLGEYVTARRLQLGMTQGDVYAAGGPSVATMRLIEGALQASYRGAILAKLEHALGWESGSVGAILGGGEPRDASSEAATVPSRGESDVLIAAIWNSDLPDEDKVELIDVLLSERREAERRVMERLSERIRLRRRYAS